MATADDVQLSPVTSGSSNPLVQLLQHQTKVSRICLGDDIHYIGISLMFTLYPSSSPLTQVWWFRLILLIPTGSGYRQGEGEEIDKVQGRLWSPQSQIGITAWQSLTPSHGPFWKPGLRTWQSQAHKRDPLSAGWQLVCREICQAGRQDCGAEDTR